MDLTELVRTRRTHKAYFPEALDRSTIDSLLDLARWAPNHNLTNPWRFRVVGPQALGRLKVAAGPEAGPKLDRAPTLIAASALQCGTDPLLDEEDLLAAGCAVYIVLLAAHERGLAGYWRTPGVLRTPEGRAAVGIPDGEHVLGLIHLGRARGEKSVVPERASLDTIREYLD